MSFHRDTQSPISHVACGRQGGSRTDVLEKALVLDSAEASENLAENQRCEVKLLIRTAYCGHRPDSSESHPLEALLAACNSIKPANPVLMAVSLSTNQSTTIGPNTTSCHQEAVSAVRSNTRTMENRVTRYCRHPKKSTATNHISWSRPTATA